MEEKKKYIMPIILVIVVIIAIIEGIVIITMNNKYNPVSNEQRQGKMSKEEMFAIAETFDGKEASSSLKTNVKNAKDIYDNKIVTFTCKVDTVENTYVKVRSEGTITTSTIYLSDEELKTLIQKQEITVVGKITNFKKYGGDGSGGSYYFTMEEAYLLTKEETKLLKDKAET